MRKFVSTLVLPAVLLLLPAAAGAQCPGQGNAVLEIVSVNNTGPVAGSEVTIRVTGTPNQHLCLACDLGPGPTLVPGLVPLCLDMSSNLLEIVFFLPPSGVMEFTVRIPQELAGTLLCCQALGFESGAPNGIAVSNAVCLSIEGPCVSGGVSEVGYLTRLSNVSSFPVTVTSGVVGRAGGGGSPTTTVMYDPASPPAFPVSDNGSVIIENISRVGSDLYVSTLVRASSDLSHRSHSNRLPNELMVRVGADSSQNSETIHTSCSQPLAVGMVFGEYTITRLAFP